MSKKERISSERSGGTAKRLKPIYVLIFLIAAELVFTTFVFCNYKDSFHSDEIWSYGLSNSYYQPFIFIEDGIYLDDTRTDDLINLNEWLPGSVMNDYVTVQPNERFAYDSVYHNQTLDHHPPLYYMLLHTVCSFFPNTFSPYFGFFLNCVFLIMTQIFLYKLSKLMFGSDFFALVVCFFYGAGTGALSTFIFIRQYSLLTMLTVMYLYFNSKLFYDSESDLKKKLPAIAVTAFAAFMTHYFAIVFIGAFTACFCLSYLFRKKIKKMFVYGGTILLTLVIFFAVYPAALMQLNSNPFYGSTNFSYFSQMRFFIVYICRNTMGIRITMYKDPSVYYVIAAIFSLVVLCIPLCFLFRKEEWFKKNVLGGVKHVLGRIRASLLQGDRFPIFIMAAAAAELLVVNKVVNPIKMGNYAQRYIFNLFPYGSLMMVYAVRLAISLLPKIKDHAKPIVAVIVALLTVNIHISENTPFTMDAPVRYQQIIDDLAGKNCLFVFQDHNQIPTNYTVFTAFAHKAEHVFCTYYSLADTYSEEILDSGIDVDYVIITVKNYYLPDQLAEAKAKLGSDKAAQNDSGDDKPVNGGIDEEERIRLTETFNSIFGDDELVPVYDITTSGGTFHVLSVG